MQPQEQKRFYVTLDRPDFERLAAEAQRERRDVRDQAAIVLAKALPSETKTAAPETATA
jgi:hypothetical protein